MPDPKIIRIYGTAPNLGLTPPPPKGAEVWLSNNELAYRQRLPRAFDEYTHYFNLHSRAHMDTTYPHCVKWYQKQDGSRPFYFQKHQPDIPGSTVYPLKELRVFFPEAIAPNGAFYSTCSICSLIPFAIYRAATTIELWGFQLSDRKPRDAYLFERPCFFYWVKQARDRGIEVMYQDAIAALAFEPGSPKTYGGTTYGYGTRPEPEWDPITQTLRA